MLELTKILLLYAVIRNAQQQLQIQVTQTRHNSSELVLNYIHPAGFTLDWYITSYINLPKDGVGGVLLYQPIECPRDSPVSLDFLESCAHRNFSLILLVQNLFNCPGKVIGHAQNNGFTGVITYGNDDQHLEVRNKIYDASTKSVVDLGSTGLMIVSVSEKFATTLRNEVAVSNCSSEDYKMTLVTLGSLQIEGIRFGLSIFIILSVISGFLGVLALPFLLVRCLNRKSGSYNVHTIQMLELGYSTPRQAHEQTMYSLYRPTLKKFDSKGNSSSSTCPICLDAFIDGEDVSMLSCEGQHEFHPACITTWLSSQSTCPVCRNTLQTNL